MLRFGSDAVVGFVDQVVDNMVSGWARSGPEMCKVELWVDDDLVVTSAASRLRPDLVGVASETGKCGFVIAVPAALCDGRERSIEVRFAGTSRLLENGRRLFSHVFRFPAPLVDAKPAPDLAPRAREVLRLLRPWEVVGGRFIRRGRRNDGGYVMLDHGLSGSTCYSLGINDDVSWDLDMAHDGSTIFQFDHTIDAVPDPHPSFRWQKRGIASRTGGEFASIPDLVAENGHANRTDLVLKMDIEGFEWPVLEHLPTETLATMSQIVAEFHLLTTIDQEEQYRLIRSCLLHLNRTHRLVHIHANNCGSIGLLGGVMLPDTIEVTYVRSADHQFTECRRVFPTELDMPCNPNAADFYLGAMGLNA